MTAFVGLTGGAEAAEVHPVITIDGDASLDTIAASELWNGTGTVDDPYVIENYDIDAGEVSGVDCISIHDTTKYIIIRNCSLFGSLANGIELLNADHVSMVNCAYWDVEWGFDIRTSSDIAVIGCNGTTSGIGIGIMVSGCDNITIADCEIGSNSASAGIFLSGCRDASLNNNDVTGQGTGVYVISSSFINITGTTSTEAGTHVISLEDTDNVTVSWSSIMGGGTDASIGSQGCSAIWLHNNTFQDEQGYSISATGCSGALIANNTVSWTGDPYGPGTIYLTGSGVVVEHNLFTGVDKPLWISAPGCMVRNNTAVGMNSGFFVYQASGAVVEHNDLSDSVSGVVVQESPSAIVRDNTISLSGELETSGTAISVAQSNGALVANNIISGTMGSGLAVRYSESVTLSENQLSIVANYGVYSDNSYYLTVQENTIAGGVTYGISIYDGVEATIIGNTASGFRDGLHVDEFSNLLAQGNDFSLSTETGIRLISSGGGTAALTDNDCRGSGFDGIAAYMASSLAISRNNCSGSMYGIVLTSCSASVLEGNECNDCTNEALNINECPGVSILGGNYSRSINGIYLSNSYGSCLEGVNASGNMNAGLTLFHSDYSTIANSTFSNNQHGIDGGSNVYSDYDPSGLKIYGCRFENNSGWGAVFYQGAFSNIYGNFFAWNGDYAVSLTGSTLFYVYNNTFLNNNGITEVGWGSQAYDSGENNQWYQQGTSEAWGNRWSNLRNLDYDGDGRVDENYRINSPYGTYVYDSYPLPYGPKIEAPSAPADVTAEVTGWFVTVNFTTPASTGNSTIFQYMIYRGPASSPSDLVFIGYAYGNTYQDKEGIQNGEAYAYAVSAINQDLFESELSATATVLFQPFLDGDDAPFIITSDEEFASMAGNMGWPGDGSAASPYIIEGLVIDGFGSEQCILISGTTAHFVLKDCYLYFGTITEYGYGTGIHLVDVINARIEGCTISACPSDDQIWVERSQVDIDGCFLLGSYRCINLMAADGSSVRNSTFSGGTVGIDVQGTNGMTLSGNTFNGVTYGVRVYDSAFISVSNNSMPVGYQFLEASGCQYLEIANNEAYGMTYFASVSASNYVLVNGNVMTGLGAGTGVRLNGGYMLAENNTVQGFLAGIEIRVHDSVVSNNTIAGCEYGILSMGSVDNLLVNNVVSSGGYGLYLVSSSDSNLIKGNRFVGNSLWGIYVEFSQDNVLYANYFEGNNGNTGSYDPENHPQAVDNGGNNLWDQDGVGNYWTDLCSPDTDGDGIVDVPYAPYLLNYAMDNYPLSCPFGAPTSLGASIGADYVDLRWEQPLYDFSGDIAGYIIYRQNGLGQFVAIGTTTGLHYNDTGLVLGTLYYYRVAAYNLTVTGPMTGVFSARPAYLPGAPSDLSVERGVNEITLTWAAPSNGGSAITGYAIWRGTSSGNLAFYTNIGNVTSFVDSALENGAAYFYAVRAINQIGSGPLCAAVQGAAYDVPSAPQNVAAQFGNGNVTVTWSAPQDNGGLAVTGYRVTLYHQSSVVGTYTVSATTFSLLCEGLANGNAYDIIVEASNSIGFGDGSAQIECIPATTPGEVSGLTAAIGDHEVALSWSLPGEDGGDAPSSFKIYRGTVLGSYILIGTAATMAYIDLTAENSVLYFYYVSAVNKAGEGDISEPVSCVAGMPMTPSVLTAVVDDKNVVLGWTSPALNGGDLIGYKIYRGTSSGELVYLALVGEATTYMDWQVDPGTTYYYAVSAVTDRGEGDVSGEASVSLPMRAPEAPRQLSVDISSGTAILSWLASQYSSQPTDYLIYRGTEAGTLLYIGHTGSASVLTFTDVSYHAEFGYNYVVKASNAYGVSEASNMVYTDAYVPPVPSAPQGLMAEGDSTSVLLTWAAPSEGAPFMKYQIFRGIAPGEGVLVADVTGLYYLDSGLTNGVTYHYAVRAVNAHGSGANATASAMPIGVPDAPEASASSGDGWINVTWTEPADQGSAITAYVVYRGSATGSMVFLSLTTEKFYNDTGLSPGVARYYSVRAINDVGLGELSGPVSATTPATVPGVPGAATATAGDDVVSLTWDAPSNGGSAITSYAVYRSVGNGPLALLAKVTVPAYNDTTAVPGVEYQYRISARNAFGEGSMTAAIEATIDVPEGSAPGAPSSLQVANQDTAILVTWTPPASSGSSAITGYRIYRSVGSGSSELVAILPASATSYSDIAVVDGQEYHYWVVAENSSGQGELPAEGEAITAKLSVGKATAPAEVPVLVIGLSVAAMAVGLVAIALVLMVRKK